MAVSKEALEILRCPVCRVPVHPVDSDSGLKCDTCGRIYPVRDEIPVMLPEEASNATK